MTAKISKKDKLNTMLEMWYVLRGENKTRPFRTVSNDYKIMMALQVVLATMLGITTEYLKALADEKTFSLPAEDELPSPESAE